MVVINERTPLLGNWQVLDSSRDTVVSCQNVWTGQSRRGSACAWQDTTQQDGLEGNTPTTRLLKDGSGVAITIEDAGLKEDQNGSLLNTGKYLVTISEARFWSCFIACILLWFIAQFDTTLLASSHPVITSYFGASNSASWLSTSFLLTSTASQPLVGRVSDTFGRKIPLLVSIVIFAVGTAWCGISQSIYEFIVARAVCGLGAGCATAIGGIVINDIIPLERRGSYLSLLNLAFGVGNCLGAALGGYLTDVLGWRWAFGIQVPLIVLCFITTWITTPNDLGPCLSKVDKQDLWHTLKGFDLAGSFLLTTSIGFLILALNLGGNVLDWSHPFIIASFVLFAVLGGWLIKVEANADKPIVPLYLLTKTPCNNLIFSFFFACWVMNTVYFNVPLFFQSTLLDTPTRSGTRLLLPFIFHMFTSFLTGNYITYTKTLRPTLILGMVMLIIGSFALTVMTRSLPSWIYSWLVAASTIGQGLSFVSLTISLLAVTDAEDMAVATSTMLLLRGLGTVLGIAVSSLVFQNALPFYLEKFVDASDKLDVIDAVKKSVHAIKYLRPDTQSQVIEAYACAMKVTFGQAIVAALIGLLLVFWIKLPRLSSHLAALHCEE